MVNSDAIVTVPCPRLIIPKTIMPGAGMRGAKGFGKTQSNHLTKRLAALWKEKRVLGPLLGICGIFFLWNYIVISGH